MPYVSVVKVWLSQPIPFSDNLFESMVCLILHYLLRLPTKKNQNTDTNLILNSSPFMCLKLFIKKKPSNVPAQLLRAIVATFIVLIFSAFILTAIFY